MGQFVCMPFHGCFEVPTGPMSYKFNTRMSVNMQIPKISDFSTTFPTFAFSALSDELLVVEIAGCYSLGNVIFLLMRMFLNIFLENIS